MNKILKLYNEKFVTELFKKEVLPKYKDFVDIEKIEIQKHKTNIWEETWHVVVEFKTYFIDQDGNKELKLIFCVAHSDEPRKNVHAVLEYLWENNFSTEYLTIPKPLFYSEDFEGVFYEGVEGINLYQFIRVKDKEKVEEIIPKAAEIFARLNNMPINNAYNFNKENSRIKTVIPGAEHIIKRIEEKYPEYTKLYQEAYEYFIKKEEDFFSNKDEKWLVHGDAHPENVIRMSGDKIALIDFSDMCLSDFARDLGCFSQQIEFMIMRKICDQDYAEKIKKMFFDNYAKFAKIKIDNNLQERIDVYYYWTAVRTATYFLLKDDPEPQRASSLLAQVEKKLKKL